MPLQRPERVFAVVALFITAGVVWFSIDRLVDTGVRLSGRVEYCNGSGSHQRGPGSCLILISGENRRVCASMRTELPGYQVRLAEMRRAVTGGRFYFEANSNFRWIGP